MRFWKKKTEPVIVPPRISREELQARREQLAEQVVKDLREQQIGLQPDQRVPPPKPVDESLVLQRLGVPPKRYYIADTNEIRTVMPRIRATMPDEEALLENIRTVRKVTGDNE